MQGWKMKSLGRRLGMECDCGVIQLSLPFRCKLYGGVRSVE